MGVNDRFGHSESCPTEILCCKSSQFMKAAMSAYSVMKENKLTIMHEVGRPTKQEQCQVKGSFAGNLFDKKSVNAVTKFY